MPKTKVMLSPMDVPLHLTLNCGFHSPLKQAAGGDGLTYKCGSCDIWKGNATQPNKSIKIMPSETTFQHTIIDSQPKTKYLLSKIRSQNVIGLGMEKNDEKQQKTLLESKLGMQSTMESEGVQKSHRRKIVKLSSRYMQQAEKITMDLGSKANA